MKKIKRSPTRFVEYLAKHREKSIMRNIVMNQSNAYIRFGNFSNEILDGKTQYVFPPDKVKTKELAKLKKGIYLFRMVREDAKKWLKANPDFKIPTKSPVNRFNNSFNDQQIAITGTDVNNAYWTIAYNFGIVRKLTYEKGLSDQEFKKVRLASLSTLGAGKRYMVMVDGELTNDEILIGADERLADVYKLIRYTCFEYMNELADMLKDDFIAYKTDCIYYIDTKENRNKVYKYLKGKKLQYKQLYDKKPPAQTEG